LAAKIAIQNFLVQQDSVILNFASSIIMKRNKLGSSDVEISEVVFGAWAIGGWMWGGTDEADAIKAIHKAIDEGITTIDTAPIYGYGLSEELVGNAIKGIRQEVEILTKFGLRWDTAEGEFYFESTFPNGSSSKIHKFGGKDSVIKECEDSLRRLGTEVIDLYQIHWPDVTTPISESMEAIEQLIKQGKVRTGGVCNYSKDQFEEAIQVPNIVSNQVPYSMVKRDIEEELVPFCLDTEKSILAYSPLQRGVLTGKITADYEFGEGDHRPQTTYFQEPNLGRINAFLDSIRSIADDHQATLAQLVINWTLNQPGITGALVGARNPKQVQENAGGADLNLTASEMEVINNQLAALKIERKS